MELFLKAILVSLLYFPGFYFLLYALQDKTRDSRFKQPLYLLAYNLLLWVFLLLLSSFTGLSILNWLRYLFFFDLIVSSLVLRGTRLPLNKLLFIFFLTKCYTHDAILLILLLRAWLQQIGFLPEVFTGTVFAALFVYLSTLPSLLYFSDKLLRPLLTMNTPVEWQRLWYIPCSFFILLAASLGGVLQNLQDADLYGAFLVLFTQSLGTFLSSGFFLRMLTESTEHQKAREELHTASLYMTMQRREYDRLQQTIDTTRKLRHDMRQQLTVLNSMAQAKDSQGITTYIDNYLHHSGLQKLTTICENYAANALIQYYLAQAGACGITTDCKVSLPPRLPMDESDFSAILGNLLENALEACKMQREGPRFLKVQAEMVGASMLALSVTNSFSGLLEKKGEAFISSKRPGHQEGIGISSIKSLAAQYNGITSFEYQDHIFTAKVLLNF